MSNDIKVVEWISYKHAKGKPDLIGGFGGFFQCGMRWGDYCEAEDNPVRGHQEALRQAIIERGLREGGDWHQEAEDGVPVFSDGTVATFSFRAWGDLLAAVWSDHEDQDYHYMDFYMSSCMSTSEEVRQRGSCDSPLCDRGSEDRSN